MDIPSEPAPWPALLMIASDAHIIPTDGRTQHWSLVLADILELMDLVGFHSGEANSVGKEGKPRPSWEETSEAARHAWRAVVAAALLHAAQPGAVTRETIKRRLVIGGYALNTAGVYEIMARRLSKALSPVLLQLPSTEAVAILAPQLHEYCGRDFNVGYQRLKSVDNLSLLFDMPPTVQGR